MWAESALSLTDRDLRLMERLARAQARKAGGADEGAAEEIKRMELENAWGERRSGMDRRASGGDRIVRLLGEIADGGFVRARLASEDPITTLHFEGSERFGSDKGPALSVHPDLGMTLGRVSEARLVSEDVRASLRAAASRKGAVANDTPQPTQRAKIGRNALCPCGSGKKYKKCCWA